MSARRNRESHQGTARPTDRPHQLQRFLGQPVPGAADRRRLRADAGAAPAGRAHQLYRAQVWTLRERLLKLGARVLVSARRVVLHLPASFPYLSVYRRVALGLALCLASTALPTQTSLLTSARLRNSFTRKSPSPTLHTLQHPSEPPVQPKSHCDDILGAHTAPEELLSVPSRIMRASVRSSGLPLPVRVLQHNRTQPQWRIGSYQPGADSPLFPLRKAELQKKRQRCAGCIYPAEPLPG